MKKHFLVTAGLTAAMLTAVCAYPMVSEIASRTELTAAAATTTDGWNFTAYDTYCKITGCQNTVQGDVVIPGVITVDGVDLPVTQIGGGFHSSNTKYITSLTIPSSVTLVESYAFQNLNNLTSVTFQGKIIVIEESTFNGCTSLESVTLQEGLMEIGYRAFYNCTRLKNIKLPSTVSTLGSNVFAECSSLESITIPGKVAAIESSAFLNCTSLTKVKLEDGITAIEGTAFAGCTALEELDIPKSVTRISSISGYSIFLSPTHSTSNVKSVTIENPDCVINSLKGSAAQPLTLYGYEGSTAQTYCEKASASTYIEFVSIGEKPAKPAYTGLFGDINGDGEVDVTDAMNILTYYVESIAGNEPSWYEITKNPNAPDAP